jgi:hypothetical protein
VATSGEIQWPPMGSFAWPPSVSDGHHDRHLSLPHLQACKANGLATGLGVIFGRLPQSDRSDYGYSRDDESDDANGHGAVMVSAVSDSRAGPCGTPVARPLRRRCRSRRSRCLAMPEDPNGARVPIAPMLASLPLSESRSEQCPIRRRREFCLFVRPAVSPGGDQPGRRRFESRFRPQTGTVETSADRAAWRETFLAVGCKYLCAVELRGRGGGDAA